MLEILVLPQGDPKSLGGSVRGRLGGSDVGPVSWPAAPRGNFCYAPALVALQEGLCVRNEWATLTSLSARNLSGKSWREDGKCRLTKQKRQHVVKLWFYDVDCLL